MTTTTINSLQIRRILGKESWSVPIPFGPDGWEFDGINGNVGRIFVTASDWKYDDEWKGLEFLHASIARPEMPTYDDLKLLHSAIFKGFAYQVFSPASSHINIHNTALHLWGRVDGKPWGIPDFGVWGQI